MIKKLLFATMLISLIALVYASSYLSAILNAGSGFSARSICSGFFISGMPGELIVDEALVSASSLLSNVSFTIDGPRQRVDTQIFGLFKRRAEFVDGVGCTLLPSGQDQLHRNLGKLETEELDQQLDWPQGSAAVSDNKQLVSLLEQAFSEPNPERLRNTKAVVVVHQGRLVAEKYADGVMATTPLMGWSMSKSVTNLLLGILIHDGELSLGQSAPVPTWQQEPNDPRSVITIDQLLRMSSGLEFKEQYGLYSDVTKMLTTEADAAEFAAAKPLFKKPDSFWAYSSGTSNILSAIIRLTIDGEFQDYYEFPQKRLFQPLGIQSATMETDFNGTFIGSSLMYASARDWARLGQFCLQDGIWQGRRLLPDDWIKYSTTPTATNPKNNYGAHFWLNADPQDPQQTRSWPSLPNDAYSMSGFQGQRVIIIPSKELVVVRMGFSHSDNRGIEELVAGLIKELE